MTNQQVSEGDVFQPGQVVPVSGIYECDSDCGHQWSTDVKGHRFPPLQDGCSGHGWKLVSKTPSGAAGD
ncbi:hypothetical protein GCM10023191_071000 [Actinoallomurus oryzae]|jgi:hypothetical protein|uniref:Uncharacterized protein n=1 Tax=Actinoallomurus oryzae TaxID=502180 RepID=A0ABP8QRK3_9ACTN|nr:hypothetical protein [Actinoallomurus sp. NBC_01490]